MCFIQVNMGVLKKNEQYNEDMTDICSFVNKYVPGAREENSDRKPAKVLSGGDYLTFERRKQAQSTKRNGRTPMKQMEGLVPEMDEFRQPGRISTGNFVYIHLSKNTIFSKFCE